MGNYKPYFKYLKDTTVKMIFIFSAIMFSNIFVSISTSLKMDLTESGAIGYTSHPVSSGLMLVFMAGVFYSIALFSQAMSIRADRVGYLKAAILWGVILSIGMGVFGSILDMMVKFILEAKTGNEVKIYSQMMWIDIDNLKSSTNIVNRIFSNLTVFSIAFIIGAIWYRLKIKYNILLFGVIPFCSVTYFIGYGIKNPDKINELGVAALNIISYFMQNQGVAILAKLVMIAVCIISAVRLLIKAPIKDYANDLI